MPVKPVRDGGWTRGEIDRARAAAGPVPSPQRGSLVTFIGELTKDGLPAWRHDALCGPGQLYSDLPWLAFDPQDRRVVQLMLAVCNEMCPVRESCAADAAANHDRVGVRAGVVWLDGKSVNPRYGSQARQMRDVARPCSTCYQSFKPKDSGRKSYCSDDCAFEAKKVQWNRYNANAANMRPPRGKRVHEPIRPCLMCGTEFDNRVTKKLKYCSNTCAARANRQQRQTGAA